MKRHRRQFLQLAAGAAALPIFPRFALAQTYPSRPVRMMVGFPAGNAPDIVARLMGQWLSDSLGQPFIIENRPGAGSNIATEAVVRSPPDGYTLMMTVLTNVFNTTLYTNLNFNFVTDMTHIAGVANAPFVVVVPPSFPAKTIPEFIAYAKANPGKINMASGGKGSATHIFGELFKAMAGVDLLHVVSRPLHPRPARRSGAYGGRADPAGARADPQRQAHCARGDHSQAAVVAAGRADRGRIGAGL
jgi:tripartite-type tricarboxylate transporter receptor subunit TctC